MSVHARWDPAPAVPVSRLQGVGVRRAAALRRLGIETVQDLLLHLPLRYEDRAHRTPLASLEVGRTAAVVGQIGWVQWGTGRRRTLVARLEDDSGSLILRFFHVAGGLQQRLQQGRRLRCYGEVRQGPYGPEMVHPDMESLDDTEPVQNGTHLTPVYPATEGVHQGALRRLVTQALDWRADEAHKGRAADGLPAELLERLGFPGWIEALDAVHRPPADADIVQLEQFRHPAQQRLAFEEMLAHRLSYRQVRQRCRAQRAPSITVVAEAVTAFTALFPFPLTDAQRRVMAEVAADLSGTAPMLRLVQGDVGSGKTVIAAWAAFLAARAGWQTALMAPTEMLAGQHYQTLHTWFAPAGIRVALLTGRQAARERAAIAEGLASGEIAVAVGTHALFQQRVSFRALGVAVVDEQHRFGVDQRLALRNKGQNEVVNPHQLIMTATPIPRTMAMLEYADLDVSVIDQLPPGRIPPVTTVTPNARRDEVVERVRAWVAAGRQVYWVCPLIGESESLQCEAAEQTHEALAAALPEVAVGLLHGRMKSADKEAVMHEFKAGRIGLLVATTVIEVGIDVPNANLMIIENAERLGLSQLHQLRGRVGRGGEQSYCVLLYRSPLGETARARLGFLRECHDGFALAEKDLELRGPGEFLGTRQTGQMGFRIADLGRDGWRLPEVVEAAEWIEAHDPDCRDLLLRRWFRASSARYAEV